MDGMGLELLGETLPDVIKIEHVFCFHFNEKWERSIRKISFACFDVCMHYAESFKFISVGVSSYFFFLGLSKVLRVSQGEENRGCGCADNISRSKKKDKDKTSNNDSTHKSKVKKSKLTQVASSGTSTLNNSELDIISQSGPRSDRVTNGN
tara:strand:+ start:438 stop:890 length:453 start_codon:yes stop_codon:yes gene_type:complete